MYIRAYGMEGSTGSVGEASPAIISSLHRVRAGASSVPSPHCILGTPDDY